MLPRLGLKMAKKPTWAGIMAADDMAGDEVVDVSLERGSSRRLEDGRNTLV